MKALYLLMLMMAVSCSKKQDAPEEQPPVEGDLTFGYLSHTAEAMQVSAAALALRCKQPALAQEFTVTQLKQKELRLPKDGVGCQVVIKALTLNDTRFVQDHNTDYDWGKDSTVELLGQLNDKHLVRVQIEQQLPETLSADRHANRFFFRVIKFQDDDKVINTSAGMPLISEVRGLALTTWIPRDARVLPASIFSRAPTASNNPYLLTREAHLAFSCASDPGQARIFEDKLICGGEIYRELNFAMVRGLINPTSVRAADLCNTMKMTALPLHNTVISLPHSGMSQHMSALATIVLRSKYLDQESGEFLQSCHLYPLAPHLTPWTASYRSPHAS